MTNNGALGSTEIDKHPLYQVFWRFVYTVIN